MERSALVWTAGYLLDFPFKIEIPNQSKVKTQSINLKSVYDTFLCYLKSNIVII